MCCQGLQLQQLQAESSKFESLMAPHAGLERVDLIRIIQDVFCTSIQSRACGWFRKVPAVNDLTDILQFNQILISVTATFKYGIFRRRKKRLRFDARGTGYRDVSTNQETLFMDHLDFRPCTLCYSFKLMSFSLHQPWSASLVAFCSNSYQASSCPFDSSNSLKRL